MSVVNIETLALDFHPFFKTAPAPGAYPTLAPKSADPLGDGIQLLDTGSQSPFGFAKFLFWATGTATSTFNLKIIGWSKIKGVEWIPITLADITCTLGTTPRSVSSDLMVGTITANIITTSSEIVPADNGIQVLKLDLMGCQRIQLVPGTKTGTITAVNGATSGF